MSGGLKVGDLYVSVTASIGEALKSLSRIVDAVEETADQIEENMSKAASALGDFSDGLLTVSALAAAAVAGAAETSGKASDELERLKKSVLLLSREVGDLFLPLVREMTAWVKTAIATWRGLDAGLKANIVTAVKYAAVIGVASKALERSIIFTKSFAEGTVALIRLGKMAGPHLATAFSIMVSGATKAFMAFQWAMRADLGTGLKGLATGVSRLGPALKSLPSSIAGMGKGFLALVPQIGAILLPLLAVAAAVAALTLLAGSLYKNWDKLTWTIGDATSGLVESLTGLAQTVAGFFETLWSGFKGFLISAASLLLESVAMQVRAFARFLAPVTNVLRMGAATKALNELQSITGDKMIAALTTGAGVVGDAIVSSARTAAQKVAAETKGLRDGVSLGLSDSLDGAKQMFADIGKALPLDEFRGLIDKLLGIEVKGGNDVDLPKDWDAELGKPDTSVDLPASVRALATGKDPILKANLDRLRANSKAAADAMRAAWEAMQAAAAALKSKISSRMGEITDILDSAAQGFAAGGPAGAAVAVLADLLTRSEGFKTLIEMVNNLLQLVADSLGQLLTPLQPLVGAVSMVAQALVGALMPVFKVLVQGFEPFVPVLVMVSNLINALAPLFQIFAGVLQVLRMPMELLINVGLRLLFEGIKGLAMGVLYVAKSIGEVWNGIVNAVQGVLMTLGNIEILGGKPFEFLLDWGTALNGAKVDTYGLMSAIGELHDATWDTAQAQAEQAAAVLQTTAALDKATASLTNVPSSWRYALRSFESQNARGGSAATPPTQPGSSGGAGTPSAPAAPAQPPAPAAPLINTVTINVQDERAAMSALERKLEEMQYRARGSRGRGQHGHEVP